MKTFPFASALLAIGLALSPLTARSQVTIDISGINSGVQVTVSGSFANSGWNPSFYQGPTGFFLNAGANSLSSATFGTAPGINQLRSTPLLPASGTPSTVWGGNSSASAIPGGFVNGIDFLSLIVDPFGSNSTVYLSENYTFSTAIQGTFIVSDSLSEMGFPPTPVTYSYVSAFSGETLVTVNINPISGDEVPANLVYDQQRVEEATGAIEVEGTSVKYGNTQKTIRSVFLLGPSYIPEGGTAADRLSHWVRFDLDEKGRRPNVRRTFQMVRPASLEDGVSYAIIQTSKSGNRFTAALDGATGAASLASPGKNLDPVFFANQLTGRVRSVEVWSPEDAESSDQPQPGQILNVTETFKINNALTSRVHTLPFGEAVNRIRALLLEEGYEEVND